MKINLPIKIHNKFEIEVKDVTTGEIVQKGYAENIVLDAYFTSTSVHNANTYSTEVSFYFGLYIHFGRGQGELNSNRVSLFEKIDALKTEKVDLVINQAPLPSYGTKKIVLSPENYVGETVTEVGVGWDPPGDIFTHALIKDSAGNPLILGPKTGVQEITIYSTVYFVPLFEPGITLFYPATNNLVAGFVGWHQTALRTAQYRGDDRNPHLRINDAASTFPQATMFSQNGYGSMRRYQRIPTSEHNKKIKTLAIGNKSGIGSAGSPFSNCFHVDLPTLAENESSMWSGWEFDKTPIGVGDGATTEFPLPWDEAWLDKPKTIYVDGVATVVTWTEDTITFTTAPADQAPITGSYWVKYVPKDENHVLDITFDINYAEGVTT